MSELDIAQIFITDPLTHCIDEAARVKMKEQVLQARKDRNTLGGVVEVIAHKVPVGLGSHVHYDRKIDGRIAQALISILSVKAVEIGNGIQIAEKTGSEVHDAIFLKRGRKLYRKTNNMGGIEGGITNGSDVVCRAISPIDIRISSMAEPKFLAILLVLT